MKQLSLARRSIDTQTAPYAIFALRLALGVVFIAHALTKLFVLSLPGTAAFFASAGFPAWTAYPVFAAELLGGVALIAGVHARWVAVGLVPVMLGALMVHLPNGWSFSAPNGGWEYVAFLIAALVTQAGVGDGAFALSPSVIPGALRRFARGSSLQHPAGLSSR